MRDWRATPGVSLPDEDLLTELQRLGLVAALIVVVVLVTLVIRRSPPRRGRSIDAGDLAPGLYLFTSSGCESCGPARAQLIQRGLSFTEVSWDERPERFQRLSIDAVPSVVLVGSDGKGRWWRGGVPRRLEMPGADGSIG